MTEEAKAPPDDRLEEWKAARGLIGEFDTRIHDLRKHGFSVVTTLLTISGFLYTSGAVVISDDVKVAVIASIMLLVVALRYMERNYEMFQRAASTRAQVLENALNLELTQKIAAWYKRGKLWDASFVYAFFLGAAYVVGWATLPVEASRRLLILPLVLAGLALGLMQVYWDLDVGLVDLTIQPLECHPGETVTLTMTNLSDERPFLPGSTPYHIELRDGALIQPLLLPNDPSLFCTSVRSSRFPPTARGRIREWGDRRKARRIHKKRVEQVQKLIPQWTDSPGALEKFLWLRKHGYYTWAWNTSGVPPGFYSIVKHDLATGAACRPVLNVISLLPSRTPPSSPLREVRIAQDLPGVTHLVDAVPKKKIRLFAFSIRLNHPGRVTFRSDGGVLATPMQWGTWVATTLGPQEPPLETAVGEALEIQTCDGAAEGLLTYTEV